MPVDTAPPPAPPPASSPNGVRIVESGPPKAPPVPTRELRPSDIAALPGVVREKPAGTARQSLRSRLEKDAKPAGEPTTIPTPVKEVPKQPEKTAEQLDREELEAEGVEPAAKPEAADGKPTKPDNIDPKTGKPKKANPWKLFDEEKKARATAEAEVQRLKTSIVPEQERTAIMERVTKAEARTKELEDHIRFVSYEKSAEFKEKYDAPYEAAWKRATSELSEITVDDGTGQRRHVTPEDILELVNMPLEKARAIADEVFGKFSNDVMVHRKEIKKLFQERESALEDARKNGGLRDQQRQEQFQKQSSEVSGFLQKAWQEVESAFLADKANSEHFTLKTPKEGEELTPEEREHNEAIEKGRAIVKKAWGRNAMAPGLTPEQRREIIKDNKAVELRAIGFGPLKRLAKRQAAKIAQLEKDLQQYSGSTPGAGGRTPEVTAERGSSARESLFANIRKRAH